MYTADHHQQRIGVSVFRVNMHATPKRIGSWLWGGGNGTSLENWHVGLGGLESG